MPNRIILEVGGDNYTGWREMSVQLTMESLCGGFSASLYDNLEGPQNNILPGDLVRVLIENTLTGDQTTVFTGYIEDRSRYRDGGSTRLTFSGRNKTADLADCSAFVKSNTWTKATIGKIARDLATPYSIEVVDNSDDRLPYPRVTIQSGETAFTTIERICRLRGILPITDTEGRLTLTYALDRNTPANTKLVDGENIKSIEERTSERETFSEYLVKGQGSGGGDPWVDKKSTTVSSKATDPGVGRFRNTIIMSEGRAESNLITKRAKWEAQVRAGRSLEYTVSVQGWTYETITGSQIWEPNMMVDLVSEPMRVNTKQLIVAVQFKVDNSGGQTTTLTLRDPVTYQPNPNPVVNRV